MKLATAANRDPQRSARTPSGGRQAEHAERCELCAAYRLADHGHVVDRTARKLCCVCGPCAVAFQGAREGRYLGIPTRFATDLTFCLTAAQWDALAIPVRLAFIMRQSSQERWVAFCPSAAGASEAELSQSAWSELAVQQPLLRSIRDDVETALVRSGPGGTFACFVVPIDVCYELVALVRRYFRGFSGGERVQLETDRFFARLEAASEIVVGERRRQDAVGASR